MYSFQSVGQIRDRHLGIVDGKIDAFASQLGVESLDRLEIGVGFERGRPMLNEIENFLLNVDGRLKFRPNHVFKLAQELFIR